MDDKKEKLVLDGNAFYELDMECLKNKQKNCREKKSRNAEKDRQRRGNDPLLFAWYALTGTESASTVLPHPQLHPQPRLLLHIRRREEAERG